MQHSDIRAELEQRVVDVGDVELHVMLAGPETGPPVLLLHGFPEYWAGWRHQIDPLAEAGYRVIAPDLRGYNLSGKPPAARYYHRDALQQDVIRLLDDLGIEQVHLVGHDWGGLIGWWLAEAAPVRLRSLSLLNTPHPRVFQQTFLRNPAQQFRSAYLMLFQLPMAPAWMLRQNDFWLMTQMFERTSQPGTFTREDLVGYREAWSQPGALEAMLSWYRAIPSYALRPSDGTRITVPTLMVWGERDVALNPTMADTSIEQCDDARLQRLPGAGHWLHHEQPELVNRLLLDFLEERRAPARPPGAATRRRHATAKATGNG